MDSARILLFFAALIVYALLAVHIGLRPAAAPLFAVCGTTLWFVLLGCLGFLPFAAICYYLLAAAGLVYLLFCGIKAKRLPFQLSYGFGFFVLASLVAIGILWVRQPVFSTWDEFSFWGTAAKLTKLYNVFYTQAPIGWGWPATQMPALIAFGYPAQFFGTAFLPWQTYAACDIFQFAALAALLAPFENKNWNVALPVSFIALLSPYIFTHYAAPVKVSAVYLDSLGDVPLGLLFGAALALYYDAAGRKSWQRWLPLLLCLLTMALVKDHVGMALELVVAGIAFCDTLLRPAVGGAHFKQRLCKALVCLLVGIALAVVAYLGWRFYWTHAVAATGGSTASTENTSLGAVPGLFIQNMLHGDNAVFNQVMQGMPALFFSSSITLLGSGVRVVAVIMALLVVAFVLNQEKAARLRVVLFAGASSVGFLAYNLLIAVSYIYIFREDQLFSSYERYMYPYYIGWFLAALVLLAAAVHYAARPVLVRGAVLLLSAAVCLRVAQVVPASYTVWGFNKAEYANQRAFSAAMQEVASRLQSDDLVFVVSVNDDGSRWFRICYDFLPVQVDYSFGGGLLAENRTDANGEAYLHEYTAEEWAEYLLENDVTAVFIDDANDAFYQRYGSLFSDGGGQALYRVVQQGAGVQLQPLEGEA